MMEVLPCLLPPHYLEVQVAISAVRGESKNGYDLFWRVLELAVPGFDPTVPIDQPRWIRDMGILAFSWVHELYFSLLAKKHVFIDTRTRTNMFLRAITSSEYADVITTVQSHVDVFWHEDEDGFLPTHLRLRGIANMLHLNAKAWVHDVGLPWINRIFGDDRHRDWSGDACPSFHIQGSTPRASWFERGGRNFDSRVGNQIADVRNCDPDNCGYDRRGNNRRTDCAGGRPSEPPQGQIARPDRRRCPFLHGVQCNACKHIGHEAANCNMLAVTLFVDWYTKADLSDAQHSKIEQDWLARWKEELGRPGRTPLQVMRTYCETHNISPEDVDNAMDWD
jgi:hypothetical protein